MFLPLATVLQIYSCTASPNNPSIALAVPYGGIGLSHSPGPLKSALILVGGHFCLPDFVCLMVYAGLVLAERTHLRFGRYAMVRPSVEHVECWRCCVVLNPLAEIQRKVDKVVRLPNCWQQSGRLHLEVWKPTPRFDVLVRSECCTRAGS